MKITGKYKVCVAGPKVRSRCYSDSPRGFSESALDIALSNASSLPNGTTITIRSSGKVARYEVRNSGRLPGVVRKARTKR